MTNEELKRLEEKVNSNEFWGMPSGEHLNIINHLIIEIQHLQQENEMLKEVCRDAGRLIEKDCEQILIEDHDYLEGDC